MDDLLQEFLAETNESLEVLDGQLVRLEQDPDDPDLLSHIFRMLHTIKGTCGFLGLPRLGKVAHAGENVLDQFREGEVAVTPEAMTPVLEAIDCIRSLVVDIENNGEEPSGDDDSLIERLNRIAQGAAIKEESVAEQRDPVANIYEEIGGLATIDAIIDLVNERMVKHEEIVAHLQGIEIEYLEAAQRCVLAWALGAPETPDLAPAKEILSSLFEHVASEENVKLMIGFLSDALSELSVDPALIAQITDRAGNVRRLLPREPEAKQDPAADNNPVPDQNEPSDAKKSKGSIRVNVDVLESLMTVVSELVLTRNQLLQILRDETESEFKAPLQRLNQVTSELQESVMLTRMQPIGKAWAKLPRIVRDLSNDLGKRIELQMDGAETELDRQVLDEIKDPLTHMVRNAADHGLEDTDERVRAGKSEIGKILLNARHEGGHIILEIADDGAGLDSAKIKAKAISSGLATEAEFEGLTEQQIHQFIFKPGFSTATSVTSVSGRGVGMDVVATNISKIGGTIELDSTKGQGTRFTIKIPLTLAIISALIVECGQQRFALPQNSVVELVRVTPKSVSQIETIKSTPVLRLRDRLLPLVAMRSLLELGDDYDGDEIYVIVSRVGSYHFGIVVDRVFDTEEIVVKPVSRVLRNTSIYAGNTILGDGSVIMILDPNGIAKQSGEVKISNDEAFDAHTGSQHQGESTSMLVFKAGSETPKAVPLGLVSRIEEIKPDQIEMAGGSISIQYRDSLMPLILFSDQQNYESKAEIPVLVFTERDRAVGLVADEIVDIVDSEINVEIASDQPGVLGTAIIAGKATELIDASQHCEKAHQNWFDVTTEKSFGEGGPRQLLLVDDSSFFLTLLTPILETAGYTVTQARDGAQALDICGERDDFDIVISDLEMPNVNGFEFASGLRKLPGYADKPVIALSAHASPQDVQHCLTAGFTGHVEKLNRDKLISMLKSTVEPLDKVA